MRVAPYVGAWIETASGDSRRGGGWVAPYVGAWIETVLSGCRLLLFRPVAPYVGAWIETI